MPKNVVIFSDGTGQAGGFRFDEDRSNIYKLYRASRCGPDSSIDPREQVTFYDAGLGSQADGGHFFGKILRWIHNTVAQATGFGITSNVIDCYAAIIKLWRPGDRIFLIGFSRGAYTVRCVGGVIARCGIPTHSKNDPHGELANDDSSAHALAAYAVKHVYQFTYPRKKSEATDRQNFLLETREKIAQRFRSEYGSVSSTDPTKANAYPYFIGVFDTVAALGNSATSAAFSTVFLLFAAAMGLIGEVLQPFSSTPWIGWIFPYLSFSHVFFGTIGFAFVCALCAYVYTHLKWDFQVAGHDLRKSLRTVHLNDMWMKFYDTELDPNVAYARHAISIDENRANFQRVRWNSAKAAEKDAAGFQWFEQVWFPGNHSDIGGSYAENESRLSDISLDWMARWAAAIPQGLKFDPRVLRVWPYPDGPQHDEVASGFGSVPKWTGINWSEQKRKLPNTATTMHSSVYHRFDLPAVEICGRRGPYRPETLQDHDDFKRFCLPGAEFPAKSYDSATAMAGHPPKRPAVVDVPSHVDDA